MSKYTRLNKINHYHDSGSKSSSRIEFEDSRLKVEHPKLKRQLKTNSITYPIMISSASASSSSTLTSANCSTKLLASNEAQINNRAAPCKAKRPSKKSSYISGYNLKLAFFAIILMLLVLLVCIDGVYSLNCYHCSSVDNPECDEAFIGKANITETNCEKELGRPAKVCRKIVQYIEEKKVVIRSCGYIDEHEEKDRKTMCYKRSGTFALMMESCNCYTDNCNHSASLVPHQSVLLIASSFSVILALYFALNQKQLYQSSRKR